jgi:PAS domain-containing protein
VLHGSYEYLVSFVLATIVVTGVTLLALSRKRFGGGSLITALLNRAVARTAVVGAPSDGEVRFRMLAEAIPQIVWTASPGGEIDYVNQRWRELTGLSEEQALV